MKLNVKALAAAAAVLWGAVVLLVCLVNLVYAEYGIGFLTVLKTIYPGFDASGSLADVVTGTLYAVVDGAIFGLVFGWLYNRFSAGRDEKAPVQKPDRQTPVEP